MISQSYDTFISYQSDDVKFAEELYHRLTTQGFRVWFDKKRLNPGYNWHKEIEEGCEASRIVLPVMTPRWKDSEWTKFETYGAESVIPVHYEGEWNDVATPPITCYQSFIFDPKATDWSKLYESIRSLLSNPVPEKQGRIAHLRYRANPCFVGREAEMNKIHEALHRHPTALLTQGSVQAIAAMGGIGKTTLAREYAEKFWRLYPQMLWVDAGTDLQFEFARLAEILRPELKEVKEEKEKAEEALKILNDRDERLLILDNAEDEETVQDWIPKSGGCRTIITSRFTAWSAGIETCHIYVLDEGPSRELLLKRAKCESTPDNITLCDDLAKKLGYLPLVLEQAAAYIHKQGSGYGFDDYSELYDEVTKELLDKMALGSTEYPDSIITTWKATIEKLTGPARTILRLSAFLAPEPIPNEMFINDAATIRELEGGFSNDKDHTKPAFSSSDKLYVRDAIDDLSSYSMVKPDGHDFSVHALVQTVERYETPDDKRPRWIEDAVNMLIGYGPVNADEVSTWLIWNRLQSHALKLWAHTQSDTRIKQGAELPHRLVLLCLGKGMYSEGIIYGERALEIKEEKLGPNHPDVATSLNNLAGLFSKKGDYNGAESLCRRALEIREKVLGPEHPDTADSLNDLAELLRSKGDYVGAEPLCRRALEIREKVLGPEHPNTANSLNNMALLLDNKSDYGGAEPLFRRALEIYKKIFGFEHPDTTGSLNNLAALLHSKGDYEGAEPLFRRALNNYEKVLGPEHPNTANSLNNMASLLNNKGDNDGAEPLYRRALEIREKVLGPEHPDTATSLNNLASLLDSKSDNDGAEPLYRRALEIYEKVLGPDHPNTTTILSNLSVLLRNKGDYDGAELLCRRALEISEKVLGPEHPDTACYLNNLASLLRNKGNYDRAEPLHRRALEIREKVFGPEHPDTAESLNNLALLLDKKGDYSMSENLYKQALEIWQKVYGDDHTLVINCKLNLQICLHHAKNKDFDLKELKSCTSLLQERNDLHAEKGLTVLKELGEECL